MYIYIYIYICACFAFLSSISSPLLPPLFLSRAPRLFLCRVKRRSICGPYKVRKRKHFFFFPLILISLVYIYRYIYIYILFFFSYFWKIVGRLHKKRKQYCFRITLHKPKRRTKKKKRAFFFSLHLKPSAPQHHTRTHTQASASLTCQREARLQRPPHRWQRRRPPRPPPLLT